MLKQYTALLAVENVTLVFEDDAIRAVAKLAHQANEKTEDIGARRLHTILENVLEEISFDAESYAGQIYTVSAATVHGKLDDVIENEDLSRYIL